MKNLSQPKKAYKRLQTVSVVNVSWSQKLHLINFKLCYIYIYNDKYDEYF